MIKHTTTNRRWTRGTFYSFALLCLIAKSALGADLKLEQTKDIIRVTLGNKPVLEYVKTEKPVPEGVAPVYRRSGYIHPVFSPSGQEVTGDFPADHAHQHALFFAWTKSRFDGKKTDFWNQAKQMGTIEHRKVLGMKRGTDRVSFSVKHAFVVGRTDALHETWMVTVHRTPEDHFLFDLKSAQQCATDKQFVLEKFHYGGMAFRGRAEWLKERGDPSTAPADFRFLTSEGKGRLEGNHTRPNWVSLGGKLDDQHASVAIFGHPGNFRSPQPVRLHPTKPYFCFTPAAIDRFTIKPGAPYVSQYRFLVKADAIDAEEINAHWLRYANGAKNAK